MKNYLASISFLMLFNSLLFAQGGGTTAVFNGSDAYLDLGNNFKFTTAFTIELWAWQSDWQPSLKQTLISNYEAGGYRIRLDSDNYLRFYIYKVSELKISFSTSSLSSGWHHIACTYDNTAYKIFVDGFLKSSGGGHNISYKYDNHTIIGAEAGSGSSPSSGEYYNGYIDEVRIWNRVLSETEINEWMHKSITSTSKPSYISNLQGYYRFDTDWANGWLDDLSGDVGGANDIDATNYNATTTSSSVPIGDLIDDYTTDVEALTRANGTEDSEASTGLWMNADIILTTGNFAVFGNNDVDGKTTSDLPTGVDERTGKIWQVDISGTVTANITIDISEATGYITTVGTASDYKLLYRSGESGEFSIVASGNSVANDDQITFDNYALNDGFYAMGSPAGGLPVKLSSFTAHYDNGSVVLQWTTENEIGAVGFIIERRADPSTDWQQIASYQTDRSLVCMNNPIGSNHYSYSDYIDEPQRHLFYRLSEQDIYGIVSILDVIEVTLTDVSQTSTLRLPEKTELNAAFPNPFNPRIKISYQLAEDAVVDLFVYNVLGSKIIELLSGTFHKIGNYTFEWDGTDRSGKEMPSGSYIIVLKAGDFVKAKKVLLIR
ncbi:MAG: LamG-like jellyroll fold domain-containing protein [bacterium]|nr:LamG-like jellyroll fold domain-containing protein [bacterium]